MFRVGKRREGGGGFTGVDLGGVWWGLGGWGGGGGGVGGGGGGALAVDRFI